MLKLEIEFKREMREDLVEKIKSYFWNERNEEISDFVAECFLDFIINNVGPYIYNQAIEDAYAYMNGKIEDMLGLEKRLR